MFFRLLWFLLVSWLIAGLFRLLTGGRPRPPRSRTRRAPAPGARDDAVHRAGHPTAAPDPVLFTPGDVVDAKFDELEEEPQPAPPPR